MSILACLIGILTLMISVSMQLKQMDQQGRTEEETQRALENRDLKKQAAELEQQLVQAEQKLKKENASAAEMAELRDRKIVLKMKLDELNKDKDPEQTDAELQKIIENMKREIVAFKKERPPLSKKLEKLKEELAKRKDVPEEVESVVIRPSGSGIRAASRLFFVECNSTGIVLIGEDGQETVVSTATIDESAEYNAYLDKVKQTRDSMILFLIRKGGNDSYAWAAGWAESQYNLTTGKLPVPNDGKIDLSLFQKK
ncbi:hypothetical protein ACFSSA_02430 [Luteolibacter algae]|uniref:Uncharacterized protein n=1 Tax=Luteolibacter algae TaxID=454151 RepID=A0ABW5D791_9BACT